jgi:hypothetical protein
MHFSTIILGCQPKKKQTVGFREFWIEFFETGFGLN